jgi:hypothetical protein
MQFIKIGTNATSVYLQQLSRTAAVLRGYCLFFFGLVASIFPVGFCVASAQTSKDSYMEYILSLYPTLLKNSSANIDKASRYHQEEAQREAFFYAARQGDPEAHARQAMKFLKATDDFLVANGTAPVGCDAPLNAGQAWLWIRKSSALSDSDRQLARRVLLKFEEVSPARPYEYGANNRSICAAAARKTFLLLYPQAPSPSNANIDIYCGNSRGCYVEQVWNDWAKVWDTIENDPGYNGVMWDVLTLWVEAEAELEGRNERAFYNQPGVRRLFYRYLEQVSPLGIMPHYGDGVGLNSDPGRWIHLMEKWATMYGDGQFKWVAHRMFEWTTERRRDMDAWANIKLVMMDDLMKAWLVADDSIAERRPTLGSLITWRHAADLTNPHYPVLGPTLIPDKLVLRSGWSPDDFYVLVDLAPVMGHGHADTGGVNLMTSHGSVLLTDTSYAIRGPQYHNVFQFIPDGFSFPMKDYRTLDHYILKVLVHMQITVQDFAEGPLGAYAKIRIAPYMGHSGALERRFFFVKNRFLWIQDMLTADTSVQANIGPAWQTGAIDPGHGASWVNTRMPDLPLSQILKQQYLMRWQNKPWDLLLVFPKTGEGTMTIDDVSHDMTHEVMNQDVQNDLNFRVWNKAHAALAAGEKRSFNSVLYPHAPGTDAASVAGRFKILVHSATQSLLAFRDPGGATFYAGFNDGHALLKAGPINARARAFIAKAHAQNIDQFWPVETTNPPTAVGPPQE